MSWEDMMRRILPPTEGISPHVTSRYGERFNRPEGSSNPHGGVDFNYNVGPNGVAWNIGASSTLPPAAQKQFGGLFGLWPPFSESAASPDPSQTRQGPSDTPNNEDWSAMWRRRIGLP